MKLLLVDRINLPSNNFVTGVENKVTGDSKVNAALFSAIAIKEVISDSLCLVGFQSCKWILSFTCPSWAFIKGL